MGNGGKIVKNGRLITVLISVGISMTLFLIVAGIFANSVIRLATSDYYFISIKSYNGGNVVYDKNTHVMYWFSNSKGNYGTVTLLVEPDGKPMVWEGEE